MIHYSVSIMATKLSNQYSCFITVKSHQKLLEKVDRMLYTSIHFLVFSRLFSSFSENSKPNERLRVHYLY